MPHSIFNEKNYRKFKLYKAISKKWLLRSLGYFSKKRDLHFVKNEYGRVWTPDFFVKEQKPYAQEFHGKLVFLSSAERRKFVISYFGNILKEFGVVESVLEMGSGNGMNIVALALLHPEIKEWHGVELTHEGVDVSRALLASPPLSYIEQVTGLKSREIKNRLSKAKITFLQGDMTRLPFPGSMCDVVFSCQAIEQLPRTYKEAFNEARRISREYAFFLEEFKEAQKNIFEKHTLKMLIIFALLGANWKSQVLPFLRLKNFLCARFITASDLFRALFLKRNNLF